MGGSVIHQDDWLTIHGGDCREVLSTLPDESVQCVVTSPPYWGLRDYGVDGQLGLEHTPDEYVAAMVGVFREVRRVLRRDGTLWLNLGDSYANTGSGDISKVGGFTGAGIRKTLADGKKHGTWQDSRKRDIPSGLKPKDLVGIPWRVAFALQADGWYLRSDIVWAKPNPMPESVTDRPTKAHEYLFLLSRSERYVYDDQAIREPSVSPEQEAHNQRYAKVYDAHTERVSVRGEGIQPGNVNNVGIHARPGKGGRNRRSVWTVATQPYPGAHFATFPEALVEPCVLAGCPEGGVVLDPFAGTGTVGVVAQRLSRRAVLIDLNPDYLRQCLERNQQAPLGLAVPA